ncbi:response regulator [Croceivirga lutea]|uniref:response regulator n=1 Tax=Croceivirga lutea TaxID=1775167 RepID=UPI001639CC9B|nr:response regulator [Croceivirga lutea]GGG37354.1 response regulator [Croceivirga lutea]
MKSIQQACIIDDDEIYIELLKIKMRDINFCEECLVYNDGQSAIEAIKEICDTNRSLPEVIFLDINMPILDGWGFLDHYEKLEICKTDKVVIYMVTSSMAKADLERVQEFKSIKKYIVKPITKEQLTEILLAAA